MNVLFVSIEDLNDYVEPLGGHPDAATPNIARFARRAAVFERAYATAPVCGPSRNAVLFGQAPWRTGLYVNAHYWPLVHKPGNRLSLFGHARDAGFATFGGGKIFMRSENGIDPDEWDEYSPVRHPGRQPVVSELARRGALKPMQDYGPLPDDDMVVYDERNADWIAKQITPGADRRFWALGIFRPHMPFLSHRRYFDMIPERPALPPGLDRDFNPLDESELAHLPAEARAHFVRPKIGRTLHRAGEYRAFLRAYLATVAFADDMFGRVLRRLEETGQDKNTVVVL
ncbi:MAG: sulfatase-like hydrolase/transferase, partial [Pseudomonadota bacterium]